MSVKLDKRNTTIDSQILKGNVSPSKVYQPQWINNQTRLNQTNVELMRSNLIKYIDLVAGSLFSNIKNDINSIIDKSAGWVQLNTSDGAVVGEIFNDYDNNKVATDKKYQATFGRYTEANGEAQFVCGKYNEEVENALFIVGCGTDENSRGNAIVVEENGTVHILTDVTYNGVQTFMGNTVIIEKDLEVGGKLIAKKRPTAKNHVVRKQELDELRSEVSGALHYIGVVDSNVYTEGLTTQDSIEILIINDDGTIGSETHCVDAEPPQIELNSGDVVLLGNIKTDKDEDGNIINIITNTGKEYILTRTDDTCNWTDYSTYANYVLTQTYKDEQEKLNKALFSDGEVPQWSDDNTDDNTKSLQTQLKQEVINREAGDNNTLTDAKNYVDDQDKFKTDILTVEKFGGINAGANLNNMTTHEILKQLLYPYIVFTINDTSRNAAATTLENGTEQILSEVSITVTKKSKPITSIKLLNGSTVLEEKTDDVADGGTIKFSNLGITVSKDNNPNLKFTVTDGTTSTDKNVGASTFVYPYYMGECAANDTINETLIKNLTKKVEVKGDKTITHSCENGRMIIAYPESYGVLTSILDPNNFETIGDYTTTKVFVSGLDGSPQEYYVYASGAATVNNFKVQYKY